MDTVILNHNNENIQTRLNAFRNFIAKIRFESSQIPNNELNQVVYRKSGELIGDATNFIKLVCL